MLCKNVARQKKKARNQNPCGVTFTRCGVWFDFSCLGSRNKVEHEEHIHSARQAGMDTERQPLLLTTGVAAGAQSGPCLGEGLPAPRPPARGQNFSRWRYPTENSQTRNKVCSSTIQRTIWQQHVVAIREMTKEFDCTVILDMHLYRMGHQRPAYLKMCTTRTMYNVFAASWTELLETLPY